MDHLRTLVRPATLVRLGLGLVFLLAGLQKLADPSRTGSLLDQAGTLPPVWPFTALGGTRFTMLLGGFEALLGAGLIVGLAVRLLAPLAAALMVGFMIRLGVFTGMTIADVTLVSMALALTLVSFKGNPVSASRGTPTGNPEIPPPGLFLLRLGLSITLAWLATAPPGLSGPRFPLSPGPEILAAAVFLVAGLGVRPVALALAALLVAWLAERGLGSLSRAKEVGLLAAFLALALTGAGPWSLDAVLRSRLDRVRKRPETSRSF